MNQQVLWETNRMHECLQSQEEHGLLGRAYQGKLAAYLGDI